MLAGLLGPQPPADNRVPSSPVGDSYDGFDAGAAEQLRQDQCLMGDSLRLGGPAMGTLAQGGLTQTPEQLRVTAAREYWNNTPLAAAFQQDRDATGQNSAALSARVNAWKAPLAGLSTPAGFTDTGFAWPPGVPSGSGADFFDQVGFSKWLGEQYWKDESLFYQDPTPQADAATVKAVTDLGSPLYSEVDPNLPSDQWQQAYAEKQAFEKLVDGYDGLGADDARLFLASGGFARIAPEPGSLEFRLAVEDLKTRFAACTWRNPVDPSKVLGQVVATASAEWQQEITAQATERGKIFTDNRQATTALATGAKALGEMLGQSWIADRLTRWQDYWSAGGPGWVGDSPMVVHIHAASDKCLEVGGSSKADGAVVQMYTCNSGANQKWQIVNNALVNVNSGKCLDVKSSGTADGTVIQQWTCNQSGAQKWEYTTRGTTRLYNTGTGKCLDMHTYANSQDAWTWTCNESDPQKFDIVPSGHNGTSDINYPTQAQFTQAAKGITDARAAAKTQLEVLSKQAQSAGIAAVETDEHLKAAYAIADRDGAPRGRALLVGQQKAQVTKASAAALTAMMQAGQTAEAATRASAGDSATITALATTQAAATQAAFRNAAAKAAREQAKASADAAAVQAKNAKDSRDTAKTKLAETKNAEADAKAAAATAHAKRLAAETEEATAKAEKATAAQKQAEAAQHKTNAQEQASKAQTAKTKADTADTTATEKRQGAETARDKARDLRDDAWDAESKANASRAKADAKEAYAQASESEDNAQEARQAANDADAAADTAETAAATARSEADLATQAAADADAAATRAEAAAKRARSDSDDAQAAKLKADAAVRTATSAAADAIKASRSAATAARTADELADDAEKAAADAKTQADKAKKEAATALAGATKAAGYAYTTAQAAVDAGNAAVRVAAPANDAIQLGSPYITSDSAAGLAVLTGQSSKTIAEQQQAVAEAHAKNASEAAAQAQSTANAASGDSKAAYTLAAEAAAFSAAARASAKEALGYAAEAATYAAQAAQSLARTIEYDRQATEDAAAADRAAGRAEGYADDARDSADEAALDAEAARKAATEAEQAATDARKAADHAATEAAVAEEAAKDAQKYADSAQQAAEEAERKQANQQVKVGAGTGVANSFYVVDKIDPIREPHQDNDCVIEIGFGGCTVQFTLHFNATVSFYVCTDPDVPATEAGCPPSDTVFVATDTFENLSQQITRYFTKLELAQGIATIIAKVAWAILAQDFVDCWHGSASGCAWAASNFIPGQKVIDAVDAIRAFDAALRTGIGVADAFRALKALDDINPATLADAERSFDVYQDLITACRVNSFPADTRVLMADGTGKNIADVRPADRVLATDPGAGNPQTQPVTRTFQHGTDHLVDIALTGGGRLSSTAGHRFFVVERGWILVSDLRVGDRLRSPDGTMRSVSALNDRTGLAPQQVFDLSVGGPHTFYVLAGTTPVLVHNCNDLAADAQAFPGVAHVIDEHVNITQARALELAAEKGVNGVFADLQTAQQVVDYALANKAGEITRWLRGKDQQKTLTGSFGANNSLGWVANADGRITQAGNRYTVILKRAKGHRFGYYVHTAYPS
ncbi:RICIN domain-containing protein [Streptomyces sp. NPDC060205]|uniref:RICIN domain-containing protein n=1 Tax=Streptomyces sp. NPDC060205 TaxID=3347072 RepID=UPI003669FF89